MISSIEPLPIDEAAFTALAERHRRELHVHCYRMLASVQDAEDAVQETFLRAWRSRETFAGRSTFRAWLYRIATNAALDIIGRRPSVPSVTADGNRAFEVPWLEPYPEHRLVAAAAEEPEAVAVSGRRSSWHSSSRCSSCRRRAPRRCCCVTCSGGRRSKARRCWMSRSRR